VCPSIALSSSANPPIEAPPSLAQGDFATFMGKFPHFFTPFSLILSLSSYSISPFTRPKPDEPGSTLATLESGWGEDFAFASQLRQQVSTVVFVFLLPALSPSFLAPVSSRVPRPIPVSNFVSFFVSFF